MPVADSNSCFVTYSDFFDLEFNHEVFEFAVSNKDLFDRSKVHNNYVTVLDEKWRRSDSIHLMKMAPSFSAKFISHLTSVLGSVFAHLGLSDFEHKDIELHMTSYNDGQFFKPHVDNSDLSKGRIVTFVYYFHQMPKSFRGGELLLMEAKPKPAIIEPENNSVVFFNSGMLHMVNPVVCKSGKFEDGRFSLNGWIRKRP